MTQTLPPTTTDLAAAARGLTRTYGQRRHRRARPARRRPRPARRPVHRDHGPLRLRQVHADALPRRPRQPDRRAASRWPGRSLESLDDTALTVFRREHLGFVFQSFNLLPMLTAGQNILLPLELAGRRVDRRQVRPSSSTSLGLRDRLGHRPSELSGGQQQRVAIARALVASPTSSSPTSRPATSTASRPPRCSASCAARARARPDRRDGHPRARRRGVRRRRRRDRRR